MPIFDPVFLSRIQFAWVIGWHILLPAFTVGTASFIAVVESLAFATGREVYARISVFWTKIFAIAFGMGVVTGIVMPFQFGTNWSRYAAATANVLAPLFTYEGLTAFFLEAGFLGVLLFGRKLVPPWAHVFAAVMVAVGTLFSSFWILAANSWMQTPAGYEIVNGVFFPTDWIQVIFNPSFPYRLAHTVCAFFLTSAFVVLGVGAYLISTKRGAEEGRVMLSMTLWFLTILVPLQMVIGDQHGLNTLKYQPAKLAAIEGRYDTSSPTPLTVFGIPDDAKGTMRYAVEIPALGSLILTHSLNGEIRGLKEWPADQRPPVAVPFFAFRIMLGVAGLMLALVALGGWLRWRGQLFDAPVFLRLCQWASPLGFVAVIAGWCVTEVGRQPWTVFGLLRTAQSVSPSLTSADVTLSILGYAAVYLLIYPTGLILMLRLIRGGPQSAGAQESSLAAKKPVVGVDQPKVPVWVGAASAAKGDVR
jgi:cytochrome d ubiquinol oxidase subunit I